MLQSHQLRALLQSLVHKGVALDLACRLCTCGKLLLLLLWLRGFLLGRHLLRGFLLGRHLLGRLLGCCLLGCVKSGDGLEQLLLGGLHLGRLWCDGGAGSDSEQGHWLLPILLALPKTKQRGLVCTWLYVSSEQRSSRRSRSSYGSSHGSADAAQKPVRCFTG